MIVDVLGNPLALSLTGGQVHDITQAQALLVEPKALLGDKGYDADHLIDGLTTRAISVVTRPSKTGKSHEPTTSHFTASAISSNGSSESSSIFGPSRPVMRRRHKITRRATPSLGLNDHRPQSAFKFYEEAAARIKRMAVKYRDPRAMPAKWPEQKNIRTAPAFFP